MLTTRSSGVYTVHFSPHNDSVTITQGCIGYTFSVAFNSLQDTLAFAAAMKYVRTDSARFNREKRAFWEERRAALLLMK